MALGMRVVADVHEPREIVGYLERSGVPVEVRSISPGDYVVGSVGIERKSVEDFVQSIVKRRIFDQLGRLREAYERPVLIVEGDLMELVYARDYRPILGMLIAITIDMGVPVIYTRSREETAYAIKLIWGRVVKRREATVVRYKPRQMTDDERKIFILEGLPDVGPKLAEKLLLRFGTLRNVFNASLHQLQDVEGIGEKKAEEIYRIINTPYKRRRDLKLL